MCDNRVLLDIPLRNFPIEAWNRIADLLDPPNGDISMEIFAQKIDASQNHVLSLTSDVLRGYRFQYGQRPTILLLEFLEKHGITVGLIKYVLSEMRANTAHIFDTYKNRTLDSYYADNGNSRQSRARQSQSCCSCTDCQRQNQTGQANIDSMQRQASEQSRVSDQEQQRVPLLISGSEQHRPSHSGLDQRADLSIVSDTNQQAPPLRSYNSPNSSRSQSQEENDWLPPCCNCDSSSCEECEGRRLTEDPEETVVYQHYANVTSRTQERRLLISTRTNELAYNAGTNNGDDSEQTNDISYTENPSNSQKLNATANCGPQSQTNSSYYTKYKGSPKDINEPKCTCVLPPTPFVCNCKTSKAVEPPQRHAPSPKSSKKPTKTTVTSQSYASSATSSNSIRWSTGSNLIPCPGSSSGSSNKTIKSVSDKDVRYPRQTHTNYSGSRILISYTDDESHMAQDLAENLKREGYRVSIDIQNSAFAKAYDMGLVSEPNQYNWLREIYSKADHIILCSSKGYHECLNIKNACPSSKYLNARFIFDLLCRDPKGNEKLIQISFNSSPYESIWFFQCKKRFLLPRELYRLKLLLSAKKT